MNVIAKQMEILADSKKEMENILKEQKKKTKSYGYDSLCLRYAIARDAQAEYEARMGKYESLEQSEKAANRDKLKFFSILDDLIGEHD